MQWGFACPFAWSSLFFLTFVFYFFGKYYVSHVKHKNHWLWHKVLFLSSHISLIFLSIKTCKSNLSSSLYSTVSNRCADFGLFHHLTRIWLVTSSSPASLLLKGRHVVLHVVITSVINLNMLPLCPLFVLQSQPLFELRCSNNVVHLHTCADSCAALVNLLQYLVSQGDLHPPPRHTSPTEIAGQKLPVRLARINS